MKKKFLFIKTWGCKINECDSLIITNLFIKKKYIITNDITKSNLILLNTCYIRKKAEDKFINLLNKISKIKKKKKNITVCVLGCIPILNNTNINSINKKTIDLVYKSNNINLLPHILENIKKKHKKIKKKKYIYKKNIITQNYPKAFITIIRGCNKKCSYCVVPHVKGKEISKPYNNIINEIKFLSKNGIKEINLLGQNVNSYKYISKKNNKIYNFEKLIKKINSIKKIKRIKFITNHPSNFTKNIINMYKKYNNKLCKYIHLPMQSGSNRILKMMNRTYNIDEYKKIVYKLYKINPKIRIGSDFIIGYPTETKKDFNDTLKIIKKLNIDISYIFKYSPRPGTNSYNIKDNINEKTKNKRLKILKKIIDKQVINYNLNMINTTQKVLVEKKSNKNRNEYYGTTNNNRIVKFYYNKRKNIIGKIINIKIIKINNYSLIGEL